MNGVVPFVGGMVIMLLSGILAMYAAKDGAWYTLPGFSASILAGFGVMLLGVANSSKR